MILKVYSVYDSKAEAYLSPMYFQSKGQAVRSFTEVANDKTSAIGKYPEDFTLFEIGDFNDSTCKFFLYDTPYSLGVALEFTKS
jgi:hypothetical protein